MTAMHGFGLGLASKNNRGEILEVFYPKPLCNLSGNLADCLSGVSGELDTSALNELANALLAANEQEQAELAQQLRESSATVVATPLVENAAPESVADAYLKLHLLSHRLVRPHGTNLDGVFGLLPNNAWTNQGAICLNDLPQRQLDARLRGEVLEVSSVDKFPKMTNYVVPSGARIAHSGRVRLGAYVGEGTTVMHEGFMNFNAAALGPNMVEGRISQGVTVGAGTDLGGSASTAGTLSGGGNIVISIGKDCLISANAGTGIPLGDRCTIEAGLYITPGTVVQVMDEDRNFLRLVKARELAGQSDMLFIRNSQSGVVECRTNKQAIALNDALHSNN